jgi:hypothetical protein
VLLIRLDFQDRRSIQGIEASHLILFPSIEKISATVIPMGLGRQGLLVANMSRSGLDWSPIMNLISFISVFLSKNFLALLH